MGEDIVADGNWVIECAVWNGHIEIVKWLRANGSEYYGECCPLNCIVCAIKGQIDPFLCLVECGKLTEQFLIEQCVEEAARYGHLELVQWFHHRWMKDFIFNSPLILCIESGSLEDFIALYSSSHVRPMGYYASSIARRAHYLNVAEWIEDYWREYLIRVTEDYGRLDIAEWLTSMSQPEVNVL
jgi:hypothetical protein